MMLGCQRKKENKEKMRVEDYLFPRCPGIFAAILVDSIYISVYFNVLQNYRSADSGLV
jgi:hypothetical protein